MRPPDWMRHADCVEHPDPNMWFAPSNSTSATQAKAICLECPVRQTCLDYAKTERIDFGIWGGLTPGERYPKRGRPIGLIDHGTYNGYRMHLRHQTAVCEPCRIANNHYSADRAAQRRHNQKGSTPS